MKHNGGTGLPIRMALDPDGNVLVGGGIGAAGLFENLMYKK